MDIADWRKRIDAIDQEVLRLLNERARAAHEIGQIKQTTHAAVYEPDRERTIFANLHKTNSGPLTNPDVTQIYEQIIAIMRDLQTRP
ncbi:MAG TPA: chorismate mutase [Candidatus Koribacter sp.]|jgi:chorismate mutase-like protein